MSFLLGKGAVFPLVLLANPIFFFIPTLRRGMKKKMELKKKTGGFQMKMRGFQVNLLLLRKKKT